MLRLRPRREDGIGAVNFSARSHAAFHENIMLRSNVRTGRGKLKTVAGEEPLTQSRACLLRAQVPPRTVKQQVRTAVCDPPRGQTC